MLLIILKRTGICLHRDIDKVSRLANFSGTTPEAGSSPRLQEIWRALIVIQGSLTQESLEHYAHYGFRQSIDSLKQSLPSYSAARQTLLRWARRQIRSLLRRAKKISRFRDADDRAQAIDHVIYDQSPEGARLALYINDSDRMSRMALRELDRYRRTTRRDANAPASDQAPDSTSTTQNTAPTPRNPASKAPQTPRETPPAPPAQNELS